MSYLVLLDRDGCLNAKSPEYYYFTKSDQINYYPETDEFIRCLSKAKVEFAVVTNQQAIGLGVLDEVELIRMHQKLLTLTNQTIENFPIYFCPHLDKTCECRKPQVGLLENALRNSRASKATTLLIGDSYSDFEAAQNFGINFIQLSRMGSNSNRFNGADYFAETLMHCLHIMTSDLGWIL